MSTPAITSLQALLDQTPNGAVDKESAHGKAIISALAAAWMDLDGSEAEMTFAYKVEERAEQLFWQPPKLYFGVIRHWHVVRGSRWGRLHDWSVDLNTMTAKIENIRKRAVSPAAPSMTKSVMAQLATKVANEIVAHQPAPHLKWRKNQTVVDVNLGKILPWSNAQTLASRRPRLRTALDSEMCNRGWKPCGQGSKTSYTP